MYFIFIIKNIFYLLLLRGKCGERVRNNCEDNVFENFWEIHEVLQNLKEKQKILWSVWYDDLF